MLYSVNKGTSWIADTAGTGLDLYGVAFTDKSKGIIVGGISSTEIYFTIDSGDNWVNLADSSTLPTTTGLRAVVCASTSGTVHCFAVGTGGSTLESRTGIETGMVFDLLAQTQTANDLNALAFPNTNTGYVVGNAGIMMLFDSPTASPTNSPTLAPTPTPPPTRFIERIEDFSTGTDSITGIGGTAAMVLVWCGIGGFVVCLVASVVLCIMKAWCCGGKPIGETALSLPLMIAVLIVVSLQRFC